MAVITDGNANRSALIGILTWFFFLVGVFSLCARFGSKLFLSIKITWDDWLALAAQVMLLVQASVLSFGIANGLGKPVGSLSDDQIERSLKVEYGYLPVFIIALALIKWSLCAFIGQLTPNKIHRWMNLTMIAVVALWVTTTILVSLFQCSLPKPWKILDSSSCIDRKTWWTAVAAFNMVTEISFILIYLWIFHDLQTSFMRKASVLGIFSARIIVVAAMAIQLVAFIDSLPVRDLDGSISYNGWAPIVFNQLEACLSIVTACVPYLKPFMQSIELGVIQVNEIGSQEELTQRQVGAAHSAAEGNSGSGRSGRSHTKRRSGRLGFSQQFSRLSHPAAVAPTSSSTEGHQ